MKRPTPLGSYLVLLGLSALPLLYWAMRELAGAGLPDVPWLMIVMLTAGVLVGESMPVDIGRGRRSSTITFSGGFSFAMVLISPVAIPIALQLAGIIYQHFRDRSPPSRLLFNTSQYVVTFSMCHATYWLLSGQPTLSGDRLGVRQLVSILVSGAVYLVVNHVLVSTVLGLASGVPISRVLTENYGIKLLPYIMDMGLAPMSIPVLQYSPFLFPILVLPAAALHYSAKLAMLREHEALHDVLTGLPNRALLHQSYEELLPEVLDGERELAVLLIDLDHFKEINDTLGHQVGDDLLVEVARRLQSVRREGDTVARLGGDEFAIIANVTPGHGREEATELAQRLVTTLEQPFVSGGVRMDVLGSVGIALAPEHGGDAEVLMSRADIALYVAKERRGCFAFFDPDQDARAPESLSLLGELREAIENGELNVFYQPKLDLVTGTVVGTEALVRWMHPTRGLVPPDMFIPAAENTGLILSLTTYVLNEALGQARRWLDHGWELGVAVNLSVRSLSDSGLADEVAEALLRHGVPAHMLTLEVTESMLLTDPAGAATVLQPLRDMGVAIAVDDYGTGYSSLAYLKGLDIDELKIDRSFIADLTGPGHDGVIVRSTIDLGHNLGLRVVAEGVEDVDTVALLKGLGCDVVQGYVCSPALPADDFVRWMEAGRLFAADVFEEEMAS